MEQMHRRALPHWYKPGAAHFVTYRLANTLPVAVIRNLKERKEHLLKQKTDRTLSEHHQHVHKQLFAAYDNYLDRVSDVDWLRNPRIAAIVRRNLYYHDGTKYHLHAYCVMPNHVHVLFTPAPLELTGGRDEPEMPVGETADRGSLLSNIMHSLKSYTANEANKILKRTGVFWQAESYDHWVRDDEELERIVEYIRANPVSAGLVEQHEAWFFCSCHDRFLYDGETTAWLAHQTP
jgi:putative transposase